MKFWRGVLLFAALLAGAALGVVIFLVAFHALVFFGLFTPFTHTRVADRDSYPALVEFGREELKADVTGKTGFDAIFIKAHDGSPEIKRI